MGLSAASALVMIALAYVAQSSWLLHRFRRLGGRVAGRGRTLTGYALGSLLLALGFFLAGVPLDGGSSPAAPAVTAVSAAQPAGTAQPTATEAAGAPANPPQATSGAPESGAFILPDPATATAQTDAAASTAAGETAGTPAAAATSQPPQPTATPTATTTPTPTPTVTPTPTITPSPTLTPTPILGATAVVNTDSSTLWVRRTPGGEQLVLTFNGDLLILENGRANQGGILWQKVRTPDGVLGWVQADFLTVEEPE